MSQEEKLAKYIKISELYLKYKNSLEAVAYINKAYHELNLIQSQEDGSHNTESTDSVRALKARLEVSVATRDDLSGEYGKAAKSYEKLSRNELSHGMGGQAYFLKKAVLCALLMPAGNARKQLDVLTMDDRVNPDKTPELADVYPIMQKMHKERIMRKADIELLVGLVEGHQTDSVLQATKEHNLLAASKIYKNIAITELGQLLQINAQEAELVAAGMMKEGRLKGSVDQEENMISFEDAAGELSAWDGQIKGGYQVTFVALLAQPPCDFLWPAGVCEAMNSVMQSIQQKHEDYEME
jgi:COP9 signalosome complex subunit 4